MAGLGAKFTGNTNTVISLCTLLLLPIVVSKRREVKFPHGSVWTALSSSSRFLCAPLGLYSSRTERTGKKKKKKKATALGNNSCEELVLNTACSVSENTYSRSIRTNRGEMHLRSSPGTRLSRIAFNSATVLWMV